MSYDACRTSFMRKPYFCVVDGIRRGLVDIFNYDSYSLSD